MDCQNVSKFSSSMYIHDHLIIQGFMSDYTCWNMHGEEGLNDRGMHLGDTSQGISSSQETMGQDGEEGLSGSQDDEALHDSHRARHDINEDDLDDIDDHYVNIAN
ncbi:hypothetical protein PR202_ga31464 [Eleusine coracana subsp. coracana]|uniref:Transposase-associated domain-containing protein n=1 Tax=Eleusine coracana subsp. coracana TaxID=191504 RepID=A0AAV5DRJ8_ELECO|nr:hypothetical protein PR202_ga31464 [Eleusine coracana subsp. coracana]